MSKTNYFKGCWQFTILLSQFDLEPIREELRSKAGYHEQVLDDEVHAYSIDTGKKLKTPISKRLVTKLKRLFMMI